MKKYLFLLVVSGILISCNDLKGVEKEPDYLVEESANNNYEKFESEILTKYLGDGIIDVDVAPFSKGIDILLVTDNKGVSQEKFSIMAEEIVREFKEKFNLDTDVEIGVSLDYQPNLEEDIENLFVTEIK